MAGSYKHVVDDQGRLLPPKRLCSMLECMSGDVYEAVEEMYGMVWHLASEFSDFIGDHSNLNVTPEDLVEEARQKYEEGLDKSPGLLGPRTSEVVRAQMRHLLNRRED